MRIPRKHSEVSTDRWNTGQKTQPVSTGRGEWGQRKHMSPQQRRDSGAYWARAKSISGFFQFDSVTFCRCTPAAARLRNLYIFIPYLSQEHRVMIDLKLLESFLTCKTSTTRELPKELRLFCCVNVTGGGQQIERK